MKDDLEEKVFQANIRYHSALAQTYDAKQSHFLPENQIRVEGILANLAAKTGGGSLLDLGCGTGFIINLAKKYFKRIVGVDITQDMISQVEMVGSQVELYKADTKDLSFLMTDTFDVCTAYGFLHHLFDMQPTLRESFRLLRSGGIYYSDQDPNYYYWRLMKDLRGQEDLSEILRKEIRSVVDISEDISTATGLSPEMVSLAEFQKVKQGGLEADTVVAILKGIGFTSIQYRYEWFLGEGKVFHQQSQEDTLVIETYLRRIIPATRHLFKYISFYVEK